jgi:glucosamine--fructose-6-phosphate aminotransferase (isomerizing)
MCGIVGGISERNVVPLLLEGLSRLEYRGYDSAGIAVVSNGATSILRERCINRVQQLMLNCKENNLKGTIGIAHTRWATHGGVTENNAHPHISHDLIALVHNGIIENYVEVRNELMKDGYVFASETDSEVIVHLIHSFYVKENNLLHAVQNAVKKLRGAYAIGVICKDNLNVAIAASFGAPIVLGVGIDEMFFASDIAALLPVTQNVVYLHDGDVAEIMQTSFTVYDITNAKITRNVRSSQMSATNASLLHYRHYMQKEIFEQPQVVAETIQYLGKEFNPEVFGSDAKQIFSSIERVQIIACGTSYNAGIVAKYWIEEVANLECAVDIASEYRYRKSPVNSNTLIVSISQSGETADTVASIKYAIAEGMTNTLAICNVDESHLVRLSKLHVLTQAGQEIGVASTKAFTTQLVVLLYLAHTLAKVRGLLSIEDEHAMQSQIYKLPALLTNALAIESEVKLIAKELTHKNNALFLGRHMMYPIAVEGALKIKEVSYIHAESYAAGELKHGPLALIDRDMPVFVLMPTNLLLDKVKSNVQEVLARQGIVYLFTDNQKKQEPDNGFNCHRSISMSIPEDVHNYLLPIIYTIPLQLLAYHTALIKGTDVDKPRNLAKSVTVE